MTHAALLVLLGLVAASGPRRLDRAEAERLDAAAIDAEAGEQMEMWT